MNPTDLDDALRAQTSASTGQLLLRAARLLDEKALARLAPLLAELVAWGLVEQVPDPADRRATLVRFTHDGLAALTHGLGLLGELEAEITAEVGAERAAVFREVLAVWVKVLSRA